MDTSTLKSAVELPQAVGHFSDGTLMLVFDAHSLSFLIRWVHVGAMAVLLGGAGLVWVVAIQSRALDPRERHQTLSFLAEKYEVVFWSALGIQVATGVGNLGPLGAALPDASTLWGSKLALKLIIVLIFFALSLLRTFLVLRIMAIAEVPLALPVSRLYQVMYGGTSLALAMIVMVAVSLTHG